jgi:hypothetical protein
MQKPLDLCNFDAKYAGHGEVWPFPPPSEGGARRFKSFCPDQSKGREVEERRPTPHKRLISGLTQPAAATKATKSEIRPDLSTNQKFRNLPRRRG